MSTIQPNWLRSPRRTSTAPDRQPSLMPFPRSVAVSASNYLTSHHVFAIAHRGGAGLAPENTMAAFRRSYDLGLRYLETDVRVTADGVCLAFHDATVDRVTCAGGKVINRDWDSLRMLDVDGEPIARIEDVLEEFPDAHLAIDLKDAAALRPMISMLRRTGTTDRVCLSGARDGLLQAARDLAGPALATALGWESTTRFVLAARTGLRPRRLARAEFVHVPLRLGRVGILAERMVEMAHELGMKLIVWTVDDPFQMKRLLDMGTDGVITDRPDLLRAVMTGRGMWPKPAVSTPAAEAGVVQAPDAPSEQTQPAVLSAVR
jgi:glycerophosphoryl diester phosphodiesterase